LFTSAPAPTLTLVPATTPAPALTLVVTPTLAQIPIRVPALASAHALTFAPTLIISCS